MRRARNTAPCRRRKLPRYATCLSSSCGTVTPMIKPIAYNPGPPLPHTAQTNCAGVNNLPFLPVGSYNIFAENSGFKRASVGPFTLEVNQIARVDFKMEVGEVTQTVE